MGGLHAASTQQDPKWRMGAGVEPPATSTGFSEFFNRVGKISAKCTNVLNVLQPPTFSTFSRGGRYRQFSGENLPQKPIFPGFHALIPARIPARIPTEMGG